MTICLKRAVGTALCIALLSGCGAPANTAPSSTAPSSPTSSSSQAPSSIEEEIASEPEPVKVPTPTMINISGYDTIAPFSNGYAFVSKGDECGYIDTQGNYTKSIPVSLDTFVEIDDFTMKKNDNNPFPVSEEGFYPCMEGKVDDLYDSHTAVWSIKNIKTGEALVDKLARPAVFCEGRAIITRGAETSASGGGVVTVDAVSYNSAVTVIDASGKSVFDADEIVDYKYVGGLVTIRVENSLLVIDRDGNKVADAAYQGFGGGPHIFGAATYFDRDNASLLYSSPGQPIVLYKGSSWKFVDNKYNVVFEQPAECGGAAAFGFDRVFVASKDTGLYALYDNTGKRLTDYLYQKFVNFRNPSNTFVTKPGMMDDEWIAIDHDGNPISDQVFGAVQSYPSDNFMQTTLDGKRGVINNKGETIIPFEHDEISESTNGYCLITDGEITRLCQLDGTPVEGMPDFLKSDNNGRLGSGFFRAETAEGTQLIQVFEIPSEK